MTTFRQGYTNRANAMGSTGPRTKAGKAKASQNARRHGLAVPLRREPGADQETDTLARAIAGEAGRPDLLGLAQAIAEAEVELRRVLRARTKLEEAQRAPTKFKLVSSSNLELLGKAARRAARGGKRSVERWGLTALAMGWDPNGPILIEVPVKNLEKDYDAGALERYERRALSRRKRAIRDFDAACAAVAEGRRRPGLKGGDVE